MEIKIVLCRRTVDIVAQPDIRADIDAVVKE
jgi:hypothetical protein